MEEILNDDEKLITLWNDFNRKYDELIKINIKFADLKDKMSKFSSQWLENKEILWLNFNQQNEHFAIVQKIMTTSLDYFFKKCQLKIF
ncbi:hypothetical protein P344_06715 [Spiroplasma mirum ATCC 29335]|uniref:Uncharacterized protein n=1 Tax=Spiroplasma mirum ATCC 29335 TaxID=838561 RepID=W0GQX4_9MOLU|nr:MULTISPECIES: hypothetical protein [Spiroplasma]AHF61498.1 hypothetical protein SMM_1129 [Spiroplasma mirum ATCC 29335]AHI58642.1 hypothetical protein P344_06715 [Spiroplasma mirum ATCC 29335]AKM53537.1 hypothetical protein SATRI_v1c11990 [Spiroplasma atrichopogonis]